MRKSGAAVEMLRRIGGAHGEFDDRTAELAGVGSDARHQRAGDAVASIILFDKEILQENDRPDPAGDGALAADCLLYTSWPNIVRTLAFCQCGAGQRVPLPWRNGARRA